MKVTFAAARVNAGLTQREASKALFITQATLSNWERGLSDPTIRQLQDMCTLYGCSISDLKV